MLLDKPLPYSVEIENFILGCLLIDEGCQMLIYQLNEDDFFQQTNKVLFKIVNDIYYSDKPVNIISVSDRIPNSIEHLSNLCANVLTTASYRHHFEQLKAYTYKRNVIKAAQEIQSMVAESTDEVTELRNSILAKLDISIYDPGNKKFDMQTITTEMFDAIEKRRQNKNEEALYTGFYDLDKITAGLHKEEMSVLAARPGVGKTAFVLQLLINLANRGNNCVLFSREMSKGQIAERLLSNLSGVDGQKIRFAKTLTSEDSRKFNDVKRPMGEMSLIINDEAVSVQDMKACCRDLKTKGLLDVVAIDYLQLCRTLKKTQTREREVAEMSWEFKQIAKEFKIPVIVLSQLSREVVKEKREPVLSDLRDSGSIEQDSDCVIFLHVPSNTDETQDIFDIKVIIGKQRNGPIGYLFLRYCKKNFNFRSVVK